VQEPILIALHGARNAGKDTTFHFIQKWGAKSNPAFSAVRGSFADRVKWAYMRQWVPDCTMQWAIDFTDQWKNDPTAKCVGGLWDARYPDEGYQAEFIPPVNFRDHMNQFATESAREVYGDDHWVDMVLPLEPTSHNPEGWRGNFLVPPRTPEEDPYSFAHFAVITDLRAPNEMERIEALGGLKVKLKRRNAERAERTYYEKQGIERHLFASELADEEFDVILVNDDNNLDNAYLRVNLMMHEVVKNGVESIKRGTPSPWRIL
jgi:hypothetical protein